jgi:hypothetical protein
MQYGVADIHEDTTRANGDPIEANVNFGLRNHLSLY